MFPIFCVLKNSPTCLHLYLVTKYCKVADMFYYVMYHHLLENNLLKWQSLKSNLILMRSIDRMWYLGLLEEVNLWQMTEHDPQ